MFLYIFYIFSKAQKWGDWAEPSTTNWNEMKWQGKGQDQPAEADWCMARITTGEEEECPKSKQQLLGFKVFQQSYLILISFFVQVTHQIKALAITSQRTRMQPDSTWCCKYTQDKLRINCYSMARLLKLSDHIEHKCISKCILNPHIYKQKIMFSILVVEWLFFWLHKRFQGQCYKSNVLKTELSNLESKSNYLSIIIRTHYILMPAGPLCCVNHMFHPHMQL